jgi:mono/diheme cytochrome c family protein
VESRLRLIPKLLSIGTLSAIAAGASAADGRDVLVARGEYLVAVGGCNDCHTVGHFAGHEDRTQILAGSDVGFEDPVKGVVVGPNLTPDKATGLGLWTDRQIEIAFTAGVQPDGKVLSPLMPWPRLSRLSKDDARAIIAYLRSLRPVNRKTPGPFPPRHTGHRSRVAPYAVQGHTDRRQRVAGRCPQHRQAAVSH